MPIYEYRCQECGHELEAMQKITADPLTECPSCGADQLKRLISQTSFALKGSGWYVTDYAGKGAKKSDGAAKSESSSSSSSKAEGKSDSGGSKSDSASAA